MWARDCRALVCAAAHYGPHTASKGRSFLDAENRSRAGRRVRRRCIRSLNTARVPDGRNQSVGWMQKQSGCLIGFGQNGRIGNDGRLASLQRAAGAAHVCALHGAIRCHRPATGLPVHRVAFEQTGGARQCGPQHRNYQEQYRAFSAFTHDRLTFSFNSNNQASRCLQTVIWVTTIKGRRRFSALNLAGAQDSPQSVAPCRSSIRLESVAAER